MMIGLFKCHSNHRSAGKNNAYGDQARTSTNLWAEKTIEYFKRDAEITQEYHDLYDGRWNQ